MVTSSVTQGLFRSMLFIFQVSRDVPVFFMLLICSLIPLWKEKILGMISILLNLLSVYCNAPGYDLCWYMFCGRWKSMYSAVAGW